MLTIDHTSAHSTHHTTRACRYIHLNLDDGFIAPPNKSSLTTAATTTTTAFDQPHALPDPGGRLPNGSLYPDPRTFPDGMGALTAAVARHGVKLGGYTARGRLTCAGRAGSLGHEAEDMRRMAVDWGVVVRED